MNKKKGQLNNVFVYLLSIIMVVFCGFLVTKFILSFTSDVKDSVDNKFFNTLESDFNSVYLKYGAENVNEYKFSQEIDKVCFVQSNCNSSTLINLSLNEQNNLKTIIEGKDNVILFDKDNVIASKNIGEFYVNSACLCIKPKNDRISLIFTNEKNKVWIKENN